MVLVSCGLAAWAQPQEVYVFKHEKRKHMLAAKKERQARREEALHQYYELDIWTRTMTNEAAVNIHLDKDMDAEIEIRDMNGETLELLHNGKLRKGKHKFNYIPNVPIHRPFVCVFRVDGRLEAMKVVKFNAF